MAVNSQPVRWPALPKAPRLLVGGMDIDFMGDRYIHILGLAFSVEHEHHVPDQSTWAFRVSGRSLSVRVRFR